MNHTVLLPQHVTNAPCKPENLEEWLSMTRVKALPTETSDPLAPQDQLSGTEQVAEEDIATGSEEQEVLDKVCRCTCAHDLHM